MPPARTHAASAPLWGITACDETARRIGGHSWEMLRMVYEEGMTQREIAQRLRLRDSTVRKEIARGFRVMVAVIYGEP